MTIIADNLDIAFNHSPVVKKTFRGEYPLGFFHIKFNGKIIWEYPKDNAYHNFMFCDKYQPYMEWKRQWQGGQPQNRLFPRVVSGLQYASPENIIAGYLDLPKEELLNFKEPTGIRYILWACDKRIGKQKLSEIQFIQQALPIVKERIPNYNITLCYGNSMTLVYTDETISIFGKSEWNFKSDWFGEIHTFIVTDNPSYSLSKRAIELKFDGYVYQWYPKKIPPKVYSKKLLLITPEIEEKIISALKSESKNIENKTVWEELIILENTYSEKDVLPLDYPLFETVKSYWRN